MKKIVIIGPESTGKSTLCQQLADYYKTNWCPEYARQYLIKNGNDYTYDDLLTIAKGQLDLEDSLVEKTENENRQSVAGEIDSSPAHGTEPQPAIATTPMLFIDTDMIVMKVWCEFVFGKCHLYILQQLAHRTYDLYLLCNIDLPWQQDELREYPDFATREKLHGIYKAHLQKQAVPWVEISGSYDQRLSGAVEAVNSLLSNERIK